MVEENHKNVCGWFLKVFFFNLEYLYPTHLLLMESSLGTQGSSQLTWLVTKDPPAKPKLT